MPTCCSNCWMYSECDQRNECCPECDYYSGGACLIEEDYEDFEEILPVSATAQPAKTGGRARHQDSEDGGNRPLRKAGKKRRGRAAEDRK